MTTKELKDWANALYKKYGNVDCMLRDEDCYAYRSLESIYPHIAYRSYGEDKTSVLMLDLPLKD